MCHTLAHHLCLYHTYVFACMCMSMTGCKVMFLIERLIRIKFKLCAFLGIHSCRIKDEIWNMHISLHLKCLSDVYICVCVCVTSTSSCMPHSNSMVTQASMGKAISLPLIFRCSSRDLPNDGFSTHASATQNSSLNHTKTQTNLRTIAAAAPGWL